MIWDSLQVVYAGLEAQRGAAFNPDKFVATLRGRKFDGRVVGMELCTAAAFEAIIDGE
jgi:hypothetical protein